MPRRNYWFILFAAVVSFTCYRLTDHDPYGRYFSDVLSKIDGLYLNIDNVKNEDLFESAVAAMMTRLDIHSEFIPPEKVDEFQSPIDQRFVGVGIEMTGGRDARQLTVSSTIVDSPAYKSGILAGDRIVKIDDADAAGMDYASASRLIRGRLGSEVRLTLLRPGRARPLELTLTRAEINLDSVVGQTRNPDDSWNFHLTGHPRIGYIRLQEFGDHTVDELRRALDTLPPDESKGLILDLRFNGGGRLDAAIDVCGMFLPKGLTVVTTRDREGREIMQATSEGPIWSTEVPMVVLVNSDSASASEIVAGCLQDQLPDHHRATICGERSYGKGTVQQILPVEGNRGRLKLTYATFWRPSGRNIHRRDDAKPTDEWGITPDQGFVLDLTKDQLEKMLKSQAEQQIVHRALPPSGDGKSAARAPPYVDPQLQRALDYLEKPSARRGAE